MCVYVVCVYVVCVYVVCVYVVCVYVVCVYVVCVYVVCVYVLYIAKIVTNLQRIMRGVVAGNNCIGACERDEWDGRIHKVRKASAQLECSDVIIVLIIT